MSLENKVQIKRKQITGSLIHENLFPRNMLESSIVQVSSFKVVSLVKYSFEQFEKFKISRRMDKEFSFQRFQVCKKKGYWSKGTKE